MQRLLLIISLMLGLIACGGAQSPAPDTATLDFPQPEPQEAAPVGTPTIQGSSVQNCSAAPGQWEFHDLATGKLKTVVPPPKNPFQKAYLRSFGGSTTVFATFPAEATQTIWNEGHLLHLGPVDLPMVGLPLTVLATGDATSVTVFVGTDSGLWRVSLEKTGGWKLKEAKEVGLFGRVKSLALTSNIGTKNGTPIPMMWVVADDAVYGTPLANLEANEGCVDVAYLASDHPTSAKESFYYPVKVVAQNGLAVFLTHNRTVDTFTSPKQFSQYLSKQWLSFDSTAYLIDLSRKTPVVPVILSMGIFDRFFASDITFDGSRLYLSGTRFSSKDATQLESGIATYVEFKGTPIDNHWTAIPKTIVGDFRVARIAVSGTTAYVRGFQHAAKVDGPLSPDSQQKWTAWSGIPLDEDVARSLTLVGDVVTETALFGSRGLVQLRWSPFKKTEQPVTAPRNLLFSSATEIAYLNGNEIVYRNLASGTGSSYPVNGSSPRFFKKGDLVIIAGHGSAGPAVQIYSTANTPILNFTMGQIGAPTQGNFIKNVGVFGGMSGALDSYRLDDVFEIPLSAQPQYRQFGFLLHSWTGKVNMYRVAVMQMDLSPAVEKDRWVEIQGCSDLPAGTINFTNVTFGNPDSHPKFTSAPSTQALPGGTVRYSGYFQHFSQTYNLWSFKIDSTPEDLATLGQMGKASDCKVAGDLLPSPTPALAGSLFAAPWQNNDWVSLLPDTSIRWTTTQTTVLDLTPIVGKITPLKGEVWAFDPIYFVRMDTTDGNVSTSILRYQGATTVGTAYPAYPFTDSVMTGNQLVTVNPTRGIEVYNPSQF